MQLCEIELNINLACKNIQDKIFSIHLDDRMKSYRKKLKFYWFAEAESSDTCKALEGNLITYKCLLMYKFYDQHLAGIFFAARTKIPDSYKNASTFSKIFS